MMKWATLYDEQRKAMDKMDRELRKIEWSDETGLPPIAQIVPPIDVHQQRETP